MDRLLIGEWQFRILQYHCCTDQPEQTSNSDQERHKRLDLLRLEFWTFEIPLQDWSSISPGPPRLREPGLPRPVEARERILALAGDRLHPVFSFPGATAMRAQAFERVPVRICSMRPRFQPKRQRHEIAFCQHRNTPVMTNWRSLTLSAAILLTQVSRTMSIYRTAPV